MAIPDFQSLMLPILQRLGERAWAIGEMVEAMAEQHHLTEQERRAVLPSGRQRTIANRVHWAVAYLNKAGLISRVSRGTYEAAPHGLHGGIDGIIREDALGLDAVYIQAKRYGEDNTVGAPAVQGFAGALLGNGATKGVFVTTSRFTQQARDAAASLLSHRIVLIDGPELARMMIDQEVGVRTVQTIRVQRIDLEPYEADEAG
jgi:restriction endonuclease Mrr